MTLLRPDSRFAQFTRTYGFAVGMMLVMLYLVFRNAGLYPMVFADEWLYSKAARLQPFAESILPSYLYLGLFSMSNACGPGFLECVRLMNVALLVGAAPFVYLIAVKVCSRPVAALLALAAVLAPLNVFSAYFMPESMYFFAFYALAWVALEYRDAGPLAYGLATGSLLGLASAVKVHALFLLPALLAFMMYLNLAGYRGKGALPRSLKMMLAATLALVAVKSALGYLLAGPAGLDFLGRFYGAHASNSSVIRVLGPLLAQASISLGGHLLALVLLMAVPLAGLLLHAVSPAARAAAPPSLRTLQVYAVLMLGAAGAMAVAFTASIAVQGADEVWRLHMRYYDFVFPLLLIIAASQLGTTGAAPAPAGRLAIAIGLAALAIVAMRLLPKQFNIVYTDAPELGALVASPESFLVLVGGQLLVLAVWAVHRRLAARLLLFALLPLSIVSAERQTLNLFAHARTPGSYDNAGLAVRHFLGAPDGKRLAVAGSGPGYLNRAMFHIDSPDTTPVDLAPGAPLKRDELTPRFDWMLVVGDHPLPEGTIAVIHSKEFALIRVDAPHVLQARADMGKPLGGGALAAAEGLHAAEPWGAWSSGKVVTLRFAKPFPKALSLVLKANAFGPNVGQDFYVSVGGQRRAFTLGGENQERYFQFDTGGNEREVLIEVPQPVSPTSLGQGRDDRLLGIALWTVEVGERP
jgi:hypothetical protein